MDNDLRKYRMMTNVLTEARHRTKYFKPLEKFTVDANVSFFRLIVAIVLLVTLFIVTLFILFQNMSQTKYIGLPVLAIVLGLSMYLLNYMLPARGKSMLDVSAGLIMTLFSERIRRSGEKNGDIKSIGIEKVKRGILYLSNGDVALAYKIEGSLSPSVLPQVADQSAKIYSSYLIARSGTTYEKLITSIGEVDVRPQLNYLMNCYENANPESNMGKFSSFMATLQYRYIEQYMQNNEYTITQIKIIAEKDLPSLSKAREVFENSGIYPNVQLLVDKKLITEHLKRIALLSNKGEVLHGQEKDDGIKFEKQ